MKKYFMEFRLRSFHCKKCDLTIEFFGNDPVVGKCPCCKCDVASLKCVSDCYQKVRKEVFANAADAK